MNRTCPDLSLCQAGDACAGHCRKPQTITVTKPLQAPSQVLRNVTEGIHPSHVTKYPPYWGPLG